MATKKIDANKLSASINEYLTEYGEDIQEAVEKDAIKTAKDVISYLKIVSPKDKHKKKRRDTPYSEGWARKTKKKGKYAYSQVVWNKTNYQLTHLLEFGHATRSGGKTEAQPHIREAEKKYRTQFVDNVKKDIRR